MMSLKKILVAVLLLWTSPGIAQPLPELTIHTARGPQVFRVEVTRTDAERERGLMFRQHLPKMQGMLFPYPYPDYLTFWMKNTPLPLDLIFIGAGNQIVHIHPMAVPYSTDLITTPVPALSVLEINGGLCAELGIAVGDKVALPQ